MHVKTFGRMQLLILALGILLMPTPAGAMDLPEIRQRGVLRHLGIPYANFVTERGEGLDVDLMRLFAEHLGVRYEYVRTNWLEAYTDLVGRKLRIDGENVEIGGEAPVRGDIIANGLTILPWRQKLIEFSDPTFPTGIWVVARADSTLKPIQGSGNIDQDIHQVRGILRNHTLLSMRGTCLDSELYDMAATGVRLIVFDPSQRTLDDMAPSIIDGTAESTMLDIPDALVALQRYSGDIKVIGPLSRDQRMGCGFRKNSPQLRQAFNDFFRQCLLDGTYRRLVEKHYPSVFLYLGDFFERF